MTKRVVTEKIDICTFCNKGNTRVAKYKGGWGCGDCINPPDPVQRATDYMLIGKEDRLTRHPSVPKQGDMLVLLKLLKKKKIKLDPWDDWEGTTGAFKKDV